MRKERHLTRLKYLVPFIVPLLSLIALSVPIASAHPHVAATTNCSRTCVAENWWNGTTFGGSAQFTISNPTLSGNLDAYTRILRLQDGHGVNYPRVDIGIAKSGPSKINYCNSTALKYMIYVWDGNGSNTYQLCLAVPSSDYNTDVVVTAVADYCSTTEGDGLIDEMFISIHSGHFSQSVCADTENAWYTTEDEREEIATQVNGHQVWGSHWVGSEWVNSSYQLQYQTRDSDGTNPSNPPQMYWHTVPAPGNNGGNLYSCDYDGGSTCTYGS